MDCADNIKSGYYCLPIGPIKRPQPYQQQPREKKRKDYAFRRQFIEKPSIILGGPVATAKTEVYQKASWGLFL